jgi:sialic acid synthase SpsE
LEVQTNEGKNRLFKRSIYVAQPISKGAELTEDNLKIIRPALGLPPRAWTEVLGKTAAHDLVPGKPLQAEDVQ